MPQDGQRPTIAGSKLYGGLMPSEVKKLRHLILDPSAPTTRRGAHKAGLS
jgi:hypothetical protein